MVTILAILAGIAAVIAVVHALQFLGIIPFVIGPTGYTVHYFSFWYALMYGLLVWVFLVIVTMFYLILDFLSLLGATTWQDVSVSIIVNAIILLYCMLPGARNEGGMCRLRSLPSSTRSVIRIPLPTSYPPCEEGLPLSCFTTLNISVPLQPDPLRKCENWLAK